jgi:hypothetical protein
LSTIHPRQQNTPIGGFFAAASWSDVRAFAFGPSEAQASEALFGRVAS